MLERTSTPINLLDVMTELELLEVTYLNDGTWIKVKDRKTLYLAALTALLENAVAEGFLITREDDYGDLEPITAIRVEDAPETECDQLGGGCTCESCTWQITDAIGLRDDDAKYFGIPSRKL